MKFKTPAVAIAAFIAGSITIPTVVGAQTGDAPADENVPSEVVEAPEAEAPPIDLEVDGLDLSEEELAELEAYEPSAEEIAEWNTETDKLIEALQAAGINVPVETDEDGLRYPLFDENMTDADWEKVDDVFSTLFGDFETETFELGDLDGFEPTEEELAEWNAETEAFIAELEAAGIPVERRTDEGFLTFDFPEDLTPEQEEALEGFFGDCEEIEAEDHGDDDGDVEPSNVEV